MNFIKFRPLLASPAPEDLEQLRFPLLVSAKYDGVRAFVRQGVLLSRNLKPIRSVQLQGLLGHSLLEGLDGELISGPPAAKDVFQRSQSLCAVGSQIGPEDRFYVFDQIDLERPFTERLKALTRLKRLVDGDFIHYVKQIRVRDVKELLEVETEALANGFEGLMLRDPDGLYKLGRSTTNEGILLKLKRFEHAEAEVLGAYEQLRNDNEATLDERGYTKRSSHQANKVGKGTLGGFHVRLLNGYFKGTTVDVGTFKNVTKADLQKLWNDWSQLGTKRFNARYGLLRVKYQISGSKDKPRFPVGDGWRSRSDMS